MDLRMDYNPRILIIDDEPIIVTSFEEFLKADSPERRPADNKFEGILPPPMPYIIRTAADGAKGLEAIAQFEPDVVLTDLQMPEIDGFGVLEKTLKNYPDTEVIVISGAGTTGDAVNAMDKGAFFYIQKPASPLDVQRKVRSALLSASRKSQIRQLEERVIPGMHHHLNNAISPAYGYSEILTMNMAVGSPITQTHLDHLGIVRQSALRTNQNFFRLEAADRYALPSTGVLPIYPIVASLISGMKQLPEGQRPKYLPSEGQCDKNVSAPVDMNMLNHALAGALMDFETVGMEQFTYRVFSNKDYGAIELSYRFPKGKPTQHTVLEAALGLYIADKIMEKHKGMLSIRRTTEGETVTMILPRAPIDSAPIKCRAGTYCHR